MNIDIKHKHAGHVIIIEGHAFKANAKGQWDLTDIWRTLRLPKGKAPAQWRTKQAQRMEAMQNLHSSNGTGSWATKRATIKYAGWVSQAFEDMVYDAFEAVLEMPEVASLVADKMASLGNDHSAVMLKRMSENQERNETLRRLNRGRSLSPAQKERQRVNRMVNAEAAKRFRAGLDF